MVGVKMLNRTYVYLWDVHLVSPSEVGHDFPYRGLQKGLIALTVHKVTLCLHEFAASTIVF
jgi:hypothetical protein